ncbi:MAG: sigma-70 family RNA polymerase sigma factor [Blastocatellia bacterium]|nr:sigma-70 family RNA polymerase sigma factor [Blastocatellia bacterium]
MDNGLFLRHLYRRIPMESYKKLTQENFDKLLSWLSPSRDKAGELYEQIRQKLIRFFLYKGSSNAEDLTDETINRIVGKLQNLNLSQGNKPITIFYGFANNVYFEHLKQEKHEISLEEVKNIKAENNISSEIMFKALDKCLQRLDESERRLVIEYYLQEKTLKFEHRRNLAEKHNLTMGAMHTKLHRLRKALRDCVEKASGENNL